MRSIISTMCALVLCHSTAMAGTNAWVEFPKGETFQPGDDFAMTYDKGYNLVIGTTTSQQFTLVNLAIEDHQKPVYPNKYFDGIYEYNWQTEEYRLLGDPLQQKLCMRGITLSDPLEAGDHYQVAAVGTPKLLNEFPCGGALTPIIWRQSKWRNLPLKGFKLQKYETVIPFEFAKDRPEWLLGRLATNRAGYETYILGLGLWEYDKSSQQYVEKARTYFPENHYADFTDTISYSDDGLRITMSLMSGDPELEKPPTYTFQFIYDAEKNHFIYRAPKDYRTMLIGDLPALNQSLLLSVANKTGAYLNYSGQLSPSSEFEFSVAGLLIPKLNPYGYGLRGTVYNKDKQFLITYPTEGLGLYPMTNALVFQKGRTHIRDGAQGFQKLGEYLQTQCGLNSKEVPFLNCEADDIRITDIVGNTGYGGCLSQFTAEEGIQEPAWTSGGFFRVDLSQCPKAQ